VSNHYSRSASSAALAELGSLGPRVPNASLPPRFQFVSHTAPAVVPLRDHIDHLLKHELLLRKRQLHRGFLRQSRGRARQPERVLHRRHTQMRGRPRGGVRRLRPLAPTAGRPRKQVRRMPVGLPPRAQLRHQRRGQRHEAILATFPAAHMQPRMRGLGFAQVAHLNLHRLADAQAGAIDQCQQRAIAG